MADPVRAAVTTEDGAVRDAAGAAYGRSACNECQRRKQKCNREWPCNHCQRRKVADKCSFKPFRAVKSTSSDPELQEIDLKRRASTDDGDVTVDDSRESTVDVPDRGGPPFEAMGYMTTTMFTNLGIEPKKEEPIAKQYFADANSCPQLQHALDILPPRRNMDALIDNFLQTLNFHYYIVYPTVFLEEYRDWWDARDRNRPLGVQYTCLLVMVCACTMQHLDIGTRRMLELDWGDTADCLSERYHTTARELGSVVPVGYYHLYNVQQLLHSCYWYKAEAKFLECWHVLSTAVREAQELGYHREAKLSRLPDFDREMAKRIWCIMNCWDWQFSSGLIRPTIIDRTDCDAGLPSLTLETMSPSPLLFMKMQSALVTKLALKFTVPKNVVTPTEVEDYKAMIEDWMKRFPPVFAFENADTQLDERYHWVPFHRYYLYTMAYLMILNPIRAYMAEDMTIDSDQVRVKIRQEGIGYSLRLLKSLREWLDIVSHRDGRFHFIIFALLDTALSLSNAIIHDKDHTISNPAEVLNAIDTALSMLKRLKMLSGSAKASHDILSKLVKMVPRDAVPSATAQRKKARIGDGLSSPVKVVPTAIVSETPEQEETVEPKTEVATSPVEDAASGQIMELKIEKTMDSTPGQAVEQINGRTVGETIPMIKREASADALRETIGQTNMPNAVMDLNEGSSDGLSPATGAHNGSYTTPTTSNYSNDLSGDRASCSAESGSAPSSAGAGAPLVAAKNIVGTGGAATVDVPQSVDAQYLPTGKLAQQNEHHGLQQQTHNEARYMQPKWNWQTGKFDYVNPGEYDM